MNDLAALLGGGAAPAGPLPPGLDPSLSPQGEPLPPDPALLGMPPGAGGDPAMMGQMPPQSPYPTTDPQMMGQMLEQLLMAQEQDKAMFQQDQTAALLGNPLFEALMSGAPMAPGAGQDAQGIGPGGDIPPALMPEG